MKKWLALLLAFLLCLSLCGCGLINYERQLWGTWKGTEPLYAGPLAGAAQWTFHEDGTVDISGPAMERMTMQYSCTDETLSLGAMDNSGGWGFRYRVKGTTLTVGEASFFREN